MLKQKERDSQLRISAGKAFLAALDDPDLLGGGDPKKSNHYNPEDDKALMRMLLLLEEEGGSRAGLEQRLLDAGKRTSGWISLFQFNNFITALGVQEIDKLPL